MLTTNQPGAMMKIMRTVIFAMPLAAQLDCAGHYQESIPSMPSTMLC